VFAGLLDVLADLHTDGNATCKVHYVGHPLRQAFPLTAAFAAIFWLLPLLPAVVVVALSGAVMVWRIHALIAASRFQARISWHATDLVRYEGAPKGAGLRLAQQVYRSLPGRIGSEATNNALLAYYLTGDLSRRLDGSPSTRRMIIEGAGPSLRSPKSRSPK